MKKITQHKRDNKVKTPKDLTTRNKYRKMIKGKTNARKVKTARELMSKRSSVNKK